MTEDNFTSKPEKEGLRLFLVRHGQTDANLKKVLQGISNGYLNPEGMLQSERLGNHLRKVALDHVFASDLQRAIDTAKAVAHHHQLEVEIDPRLREWNCGDLDGMPASDFHRMLKESGKPVSQLTPPHGEKLEQVRQRADSFIKYLLEEHLGESILACSHGDLMRMLVSSVLQINVDTAQAFYFDNASYSVFEYNDQQWKIITSNRIPPNN